MPNGGKMFTVDRFLGLNESEDGATELKMGESPKMVNFLITDGLNLTLRPGAQRLDFEMQRDPAPVIAAWTGYVDEEKFLVIADIKNGVDRVWMYSEDGRKYTLKHTFSGLLNVSDPATAYTKIFSFAGKLFIMSAGATVVYNEGKFETVKPYIPLVVTAASPSGGGTTLESLNMLTPLRRVEFSADGTATAYVLPSEAKTVVSLTVDNVEKPIPDAGTWDAEKHTFTFKGAPIKGVANVEFTYGADAAETGATKARLARMRLTETYNGATDTRIFFAGDGTNVCFYSGVPKDAPISDLYFPGMNEVAVDMSGSPVTGMIRHYGKLLVFKPDGTFSITYEPVTLTDGTVTAGFYPRAASKEIGCDLMGQVQTVDNRPRTVAKGNVYDWHITSSYYQDERNAEKVSAKVQKTFRRADYERIVTCDDTKNGTWYAFLNDTYGTVIVNRYLLTKDGDIWCVYRSERFKDVTHAMASDGNVIFFSGDEPFILVPGVTKDAAATASRAASEPITAYWESGFMSFGADYLRKYSSYIDVSVNPAANTAVTITAETDRRQSYIEKLISRNLFSFANMSFANFTFDTNTSPKISRIRLKVKKFVYYKLKIKVDVPGATATVLGFDQQIRYGSYAK